MGVLSTGRPLISNEIVQVQSLLKSYALNNSFLWDGYFKKWKIFHLYKNAHKITSWWSFCRVWRDRVYSSWFPSRQNIRSVFRYQYHLLRIELINLNRSKIFPWNSIVLIPYRWGSGQDFDPNFAEFGTVPLNSIVLTLINHFQIFFFKIFFISR